MHTKLHFAAKLGLLQNSYRGVIPSPFLVLAAQHTSRFPRRDELFGSQIKSSGEQLMPIPYDLLANHPASNYLKF
jgi:hypothetical protein